MATQIQRIESSLLNKVYVKSEKALKEMVDNGQLQRLSEYYTPDSDIEMPAMPVGSIFISAIPQTDARVHLLDGSTISQTGVYADFANLIKALHSAGNNISCTQSEFDADVSTYGQCGKFVIDDTAGTIRLPIITEFVAGLTDLTNIGMAQLDMFKSHYHNIKTEGGNPPNGVVNPCASVFGGNQVTSNPNPIESTGGSETRPKNIRYPYYIVLASGYRSSQVVDIDNIMNEVNSKLSKSDLYLKYPVGSLYISTNSTSPADSVENGGLGGGIWEQLKDRFLLGAGDTYSNGDTGGSADAVVVSHTHGFNSGGIALTMYSSGAETSSGFASGAYWGGVNKQTSGIAANGVSGTGKNMPPYLTVYMWKRIG